MLATVVMLGVVSAGALAMNVQKKGDQNLPPRPENKVVSKPKDPPPRGDDNRQRDNRDDNKGRDKERRPRNQSFNLNRFFSM